MLQNVQEGHYRPGKTKAAGWQVGVRRTLPVPAESVWDFVTGPAGMHILVGEAVTTGDVQQQERKSETHIRYTLATVVRHSHLRMRWQLPHWQSHSILQIRVIPTGPEKTVLAMHQEKLADESTRSVMKLYWQNKIADIAEAILKA
jgi:uncharacterized protein YndB with AHSA1/START domain